MATNKRNACSPALIVSEIMLCKKDKCMRFLSSSSLQYSLSSQLFEHRIIRKIFLLTQTCCIYALEL